MAGVFTFTHGLGKGHSFGAQSMTFCSLIMMVMALKLGHVQKQQENRTLTMPPTISNRVQTLMGYGKSDRDQNWFNMQYVEWAAKKTLEWDKSTSVFDDKKNKSRKSNSPPPYFLEIGAGFGFLGKEILTRPEGIHYIFNDISKKQYDLALQYEFPDNIPSQNLDYVIGKFPSRTTVKKIKDLKRNIFGINCFMMQHFYKPAEIKTSLDKAWDILEPNGQLWLTTITPYNGLFKDLPYRYPEMERNFLEKFRINPVLLNFPGELPNIKELGYVGAGYPDYFHALTADILELLSWQNPRKHWRVVRKVHIQRPNPPEQAFTQGYPDKTELDGIVLEKVQ